MFGSVRTAHQDKRHPRYVCRNFHALCDVDSVGADGALRATLGAMPSLTLAHGVPVLRRPDGRVQVGLAPDRSVVLPEAALPVLQACDGTQDAAQIVSAMGHDALATLSLLIGNELVVETTPRSGAHDAVLRAHGLASGVAHADIRIFGGGRLGSTVAMLIAALGLPHVRVIDGRPVTASDVTPWGAGRIDIGVRRDHTCAALLERMHRGAQNHHARPGIRPEHALDIVLLDQVADWPWFDATATAEQMTGDVPHLVVAQGGDSIAFTHVITPGRTPCLGCHHQTTTDSDRDWPRLCLQLTGRPSVDTAGLGLVLNAAWQVTNAVAHWLLGAPAPHGATYVHANGTMTHRTWDRHPACGCCWDAAA